MNHPMNNLAWTSIRIIFVYVHSFLDKPCFVFMSVSLQVCWRIIPPRSLSKRLGRLGIGNGIFHSDESSNSTEIAQDEKQLRAFYGAEPGCKT